MKRMLTITLIVLLLLGNLIYWGSRKEGFHIDEMFSYEQVGNTKYPRLHHNRPDEPYLNNWHDRSYYEDYLTINTDSVFDIVGFYQSARKNGAHPPLYLTTLGMAISAISPNHFTKWSGIALNIFLYIISLVVLYDIAKRVLKKENLALLAVFLSGICVGVVNMVVFIRPYMLLIFFVLAFTDIHIRMLEQNLRISGKKRIAIYTGLAVCFISGSLSHYYFLIFSFFICLGYWLILLVTKEIRYSIEYALVIAGSFFLYLRLYPKAIYDLLRGDRGIAATNNFLGAEQRYATELVHYLRELDLQATGGFYILLIAFAVIVVLVRMVKKTHLSVAVIENKGIQACYIEKERPAVPAGKKSILLHNEWIMIALLLFTIISYVLIVAKVAPTTQTDPYKPTRYIACLYPIVMIIFIFFIENVFLCLFKARIWRKAIWPILIIMVLSGYLTSGVRFLYPGTSDQMAQLSAYYNDRAVLVTDTPYKASNLDVYFTNHAAVYQTKVSELAALKDAFESIDDTEFILYISEGPEDAQEVLDVVVDELGAKGCSYLFQTMGSDRAYVYLVEL